MAPPSTSLRALVALTLAWALCVVTFVALSTDAKAVLYVRDTVPSGWTLVSPSAPADAPVHFAIALKQSNVRRLEHKFWTVSDPDHDDYQNFLSAAQVRALVAAPAHVEDAVRQWLLSEGVDAAHMVSYGDAIEVRATVRIAERLFACTFHTFVQDLSVHSNPRTIHRVFGAYAVPDEVRPLIDMVDGLSNFFMPRVSSPHARSSKLPQRDTADNRTAYPIVVPQTIQSMYGVPVVASGSNAAISSHGVIAFADNYVSNNDTIAYGLNVSVNVPLIAAAHFVGVNDPTNPQTESSLDVEMQCGVDPSADPWFWIEEDGNWIYLWAVHFLNATDVPLVTSTSYGWWEGDQCTQAYGECELLGVDSIAYTQRTNVELQKLGVTGVSIIVSSGDSGANGRTNWYCTVPQLRPAFPASSPYVTSVGATEIVSAKFALSNPPPVCANNATCACISSGVEQAVSIAVSAFASGGGFSNISAVPAYQASVVQAYLKSGVELPPASYYNAGGRGVPDVAAFGNAGYIVGGGELGVVGGTSMSAPLFSGIASLLNAESIRLTGKPLGFLNPLLYKIAAENPAAFQDITVGDNVCTEQGCAPSCKGFYATNGWDPVTGLGTPRYDQLVKSVREVLLSRDSRKQDIVAQA